MRVIRTASFLVVAGVVALAAVGCGDSTDPVGESGEDMTEEEMTDEMTDEG